ncbi:homospermidine synthase [Accumulibacter sp.]|uniref:homospermidine synthase n=1 Tax=Accumulibacter sp. TaxID=2053492 RepID=UPI0025F1ABEB|nr:saccharopine dehydrogenase C-terminal domain-containing protein [Accumulibacter sp.]MCM8597007.1 saccharopine dehydrogenase NADP-binding domain-containing protein [Accumulibacter sp.]MCM8626247.1 saccharopine dehydrogenase NADP-binding domain-containing protein [Accumulibacter sp.]MDS4051156.1 saccharopine dehydrogenase C-terminal domain-containing protein [Accumulibacter sp.]
MAEQLLVDFRGRLVIIGFGSIGQGLLPLLLRHLGMSHEAITVVSADDQGRAVAARYGVRYRVSALEPGNYRQVLDPLVARGDFIVNVSVDVASVALIAYAREKGALYLDTCIEPWPGGYDDPSLPLARRTNYALREEALALRDGRAESPTAVLTHGANPGLVSHFVKRALLDVAADLGLAVGRPQSRDDWAGLACALGVRVIHIAERDTQLSSVRKMPNEFVNTWSVDGFVSEARQPCELGWGTHERHFPADGHRHEHGSQAAIYLAQPGCATRVRSWTPRHGAFHGLAITHSEAISIADYLTLGRPESPDYRPTVHYAYHPCDDALLSVHEFCGRNYVAQETKRILMDEISPGGVDELGVLLAGHSRNAYWYGSQLSVDEARPLAPHNSATSLQVTSAALAGIVWAIENPARGIVEPENLDFERILEICLPYLGPVVGVYSDWTPLAGRGRLFPEGIDHSDPWQFRNVRVS